MTMVETAETYQVSDNDMDDMITVANNLDERYIEAIAAGRLGLLIDWKRVGEDAEGNDQYRPRLQLIAIAQATTPAATPEKQEVARAD
ncbi:hypothetical protein ACFIOY_13730 [Bradyrhizobium sp. TZ2]